MELTALIVTLLSLLSCIQALYKAGSISWNSPSSHVLWFIPYIRNEPQWCPAGAIPGYCLDFANDCGTISHIDPVTNTRPLRLKFTPKKPDKTSILEWKVNINGETQPIEQDNDTIAMHTEGDVFHLELTDWNPSDYDFYSVKYGTCSSRSINLEEIDLGDCGVLYLRPETPTISESAKLVFLPAKHVWNSSDVSWQFVQSKRCPPKCLPEDIEGKYNVAENTSDAEYILTMPNVDSTLNGNYSVLCSDGSTTNSVSITGERLRVIVDPWYHITVIGHNRDISNEVHTNLYYATTGQLVVAEYVPELPSPPVISPLLEIAGEEYVVGRHREKLNISCSTTGGTQPVTISIFLGNSKDTISAGLLVEKDHNSIVTCEVSNAALKEPMKAVTKLYMIKSPARTTLNVNDMVEERPINVTCLVIDVRPAPKMFLKMDGDVIGDSYTYQNDTFDTGTTTFQSQLQLKQMERKWNGKTLTCCAEHELYENGTVCSIGKQLSYKFKWQFFSLEFSKYIHEIRPFYMINVTCVVQNANPSMEPMWMGKRALFVGKIKGPDTQTVDKGTTTRNIAVLNVSAEHNGDQIRCFTESDLFEKDTLYFEIRVPALPKLTINTTNTNMSTANVTVGESLVLECSVTSEPKSNISWTFDGDNTTKVRTYMCDEQSACIEIAYAFVDHQGAYTCKASNRYGTVTRTVELTVIEHESKESAGPSQVSLIIGVLVSLFILVLIGALIYFIAKQSKKCQHQKTKTTDTNTTHKPTTTKDKNPLPTVSFTPPEKSNVGAFSLSQNAADYMPPVTSTLEKNECVPTAPRMSTCVIDSENTNQDETDTMNVELHEHEAVVVIEDNEADTTELTIEDMQIRPLPAEDTLDQKQLQ